MLLRRSLSVVAVMLVALLLLAACAEETTTPTGQYGGVYKFATPLPMLSCGWPVDGYCTQNQPCFEWLAWHKTGGGYEPWLATSWELAPDRSYLTVHLRQGVKFHDGSDFNAEAIKFAYEAYRDANMRLMFGEIEVIDDYTARINWSKPYENTFIPQATDCEIISQAAFEENGLDWLRLNPVGTGAFKFVSGEADHLVFTRNDDYWQEGLPYLDGMETFNIADPMTGSLALQAGDITCLHVGVFKVGADLIATGDFDSFVRPETSFVLLPDGINPDSPFYDKRVREAVEYAIDREAIAEARSYGFWEASYQIPIPGEIGYDPDFEGRRYDPDKARQLLADAGYPDGFETKIMPAPGTIERDVVVIIQGFLADVGIDADLDFIDFARLTDYRMNGWHNGLLGDFGPYHNWGADPLLTLEDRRGRDRAMWPSVYLSEEFYDTLDEALATTEPDDALIRELYRILWDDCTEILVQPLIDIAIQQKGVHDSGHHTSGYHSVKFTTWKLWMEQ